MSAPEPSGWWAISGEALMTALNRAHSGEDPDMVYMELYANSDIEDPKSLDTGDEDG